MIITKINLQDNICSIEGTFESKNENDLLFWGECDGVPVIIELAEYITQTDENHFNIIVPVSVFLDLEINGRTWLELCRNFNIKDKIQFHPELIGYKNSGNLCENYNYELIVKDNGLFMILEPKDKEFKLIHCSITNHIIKLGIDNKNVFSQGNASLYIKRRLVEKIYHYSDMEIFIGEVDENGMVEAPIPFEYFEDITEIQYYDFVIKLKERNNIAEYFLHLEDEMLVAGKNICDNTGTKKVDITMTNSKTVCVKCCIQSLKQSYVESILVGAGVVRIALSEPDDKPDSVNDKYLIFKKRTYNDKKSYCLNWRTPLTQAGGQLVAEENSEKLLADCVRCCDEFWDVYVENGDNLIPVLCDKSKNTKYFTAASGYEICFFTNSEGGLSVYTHEKKHNDNNKTNIAVSGTCYSHCVFKSLPYFNPDYKKYYDCVYRQSNSSIISLASEALKNWTQKDEWGVEESRYLPTDFNKDFFTKLKESKAEYLLIDNFVDATKPVIEVEEGVYITYSRLLKGTNILRDYVNCKFIKPGTFEYYELFKKYAKIFVEKVKECMPESHIILLESRFSYSKIDEQTNKKEDWGWKPLIQKDNTVWDKIDEYLLEIAPDIRVIDMRHTKYVSDARSPLGASPNHYQKYYYKEILDKINKIVLEDKVRR